MLPFRAALRSLGRSKRFTATAVLALVLAIGAGTTAFAVLSAVRWRALPFRDANRLVLISEVPANQTERAAQCEGPCDTRYDTFAQVLRDHHFSSVDAMAAFTSGAKSLATSDQPLLLTGGVVSPGVFAMLGVSPVVGRALSADDDRLGVPLVTVLSYGLWQSQFGGDRSIVGRDIKLSDSHYTVVGVMPPGFTFESRSDFWLPAVPTLDPSTRPSIRSVNVLARLAPGHTLTQLRSELTGLAPAVRALGPTGQERELTASPVRQRYVGATQSHDLIFAGVVACVLLIACANLANLLVVRTLQQRDELALRSAIGATARHLVGQLLAQNLLLVTAGTVGGLAAANASLGILRHHPALTTLRPDGMEFRLDLLAVSVAIGVALVIGVLLSVIPARLITRVDVQGYLRRGSASLARGTSLIQRGFVVAEVACAVVLLVCAGLLVRTEGHYANVDLGFSTAQLITSTPSYPHPWRVREKYMPVTDQIVRALQGIPGVASVSPQASVSLQAKGPVRITRSGDAEPLPASAVPQAAVSIGPDYFATTGVRVLRGREFTTQDDESGLQVGIVNAWAARQWWPRGDALGQIVRVDTGGADLAVTIVGVVADNKASASNVLLAEAGPVLYRPYRQLPSAFPTFLVRSSQAPTPLLTPIRRLVSQLVPDRPAFTGLAQEQVDQQLEGMRENARQIIGFAVVGILLAIFGIYGVLAYMVGQRSRELGIRGALGASRGMLARMVLSDGLVLAVLGIAIGLPAAAGASQLIASVLYGMPHRDPVVYGSVTAIVLAVCVLAAYGPARRAALINPVETLRSS